MTDEEFTNQYIREIIDDLPSSMSIINMSILFSAVLAAYDTEHEAITDVFALVDSMYPNIVAYMKAEQSIQRMMNQPTQND